MTLIGNLTLSLLGSSGDTIVSWLTSFFVNLAYVVAYLFDALLYPVILMLNLAYGDANIVYSTVAITINNLMSVPSIANTYFVTYVPSNYPSVMVFLFLALVTIQIYMSVMHLAKFLKGFIPFFTGG